MCNPVSGIGDPFSNIRNSFYDKTFLFVLTDYNSFPRFTDYLIVIQENVNDKSEGTIDNPREYMI